MRFVTACASAKPLPAPHPLDKTLTAIAGDRACRLGSVGAGQRSGTHDLPRGSDPEFFEQVCLAPRPGDELVEVPWVQPPVGVR
jgi:hypothetical protein